MDADQLSAKSRIPAPDLVRKLGRRYTIVLLSVVLLVAIDQAVIQPLLIRLNLYAPVINVAGRQRMLSQKIAKTVLAWRTIPESRQERQSQLGEALRQWSRAHHGLQRGDREMELVGTNSPKIVHAFAKLQPHFEVMQSAATRIIHADLAQSEREQLLADLLHHESEYLPIMDRIVGLFEAEARQQVVWLRLAGITLMVTILCLLSSVGYFVIRPANRAIHKHVEDLARARAELETRVAERTAELSRANLALKREIAERKQAEAKSKQLSNQLAHASRVTVVGQLATGLAHELNQPLAAIANYTSACELELEDEQTLQPRSLFQKLDKIKSSALRAGHIIRRMRNFLRPQDSKVQATDPYQLLQDARDLCQPEISQSNVGLEMETEANLPHIEVDPVQIQQVFVNLIHNAVQAMQGVEAGNRHLTIRCQHVEESLRFEVLDSGKGFASHFPERNFTPFYTTRSNGLGMGLAISRSIVEQHHGKIWAKNRDEGGASVGFTLPVSARSASHAA